jgi:hypothetical protein
MEGPIGDGFRGFNSPNQLFEKHTRLTRFLRLESAATGLIRMGQAAAEAPRAESGG